MGDWQWDMDGWDWEYDKPVYPKSINRRKFRWQTKDGQILSISKIEDQHLDNIVIYLQRRRRLMTPLFEWERMDYYDNVLIPFFQEEAKKRREKRNKRLLKVKGKEVGSWWKKILHLK